MINDERKLLTLLLEKGVVPQSSIPSRMQQLMSMLMASQAVYSGIPTGKRSQHYIVRNKAQIQTRLEALAAPALDEEAGVRAQNIANAQDSKAGEKLPYLFLKIINGHQTSWRQGPYGKPLHFDAGEMSFMGLVLDEQPGKSWMPEGPVILIENREAWFLLRNRLPSALKGAALVHYEGWLSKRFIDHLKSWTQAQLWIFPDFDQVGFSNLGLIRDAGIRVKLLCPRIQPEVFKKVGNPEIWKNNVALIPHIDSWIKDTPEYYQKWWRYLCDHGVSVEQEIFVGLKDLEWVV